MTSVCSADGLYERFRSPLPLDKYGCRRGAEGMVLTPCAIVILKQVRVRKGKQRQVGVWMRLDVSRAGGRSACHDRCRRVSRWSPSKVRKYYQSYRHGHQVGRNRRCQVPCQVGEAAQRDVPPFPTPEVHRVSRTAFYQHGHVAKVVRLYLVTQKQGVHICGNLAQANGSVGVGVMEKLLVGRASSFESHRDGSHRTNPARLSPT